MCRIVGRQGCEPKAFIKALYLWGKLYIASSKWEDADVASGNEPKPLVRW